MSTASKRSHLNHFLNKKKKKWLCEYDGSTVNAQLITTKEGKGGLICRI